MSEEQEEKEELPEGITIIEQRGSKDDYKGIRTTIVISPDIFNKRKY